jgi:methylase of polypeptide subunit release factors
MTLSRKTKEIWEFGDFQTPDALAKQVVNALQQLGISPASVIEPTCGKGSLLIEAMKAYPQAERSLGVDINPRHLSGLRDRLSREEFDAPVEILHADFFNTDWNNLLADFPQPLLILGNPPWVTSSELSILHSANLPEKSNIHGRNGLEALTGKSNFDISEWMILQHLSWLEGKRGAVAMLFKTAVAR